MPTSSFLMLTFLVWVHRLRSKRFPASGMDTRWDRRLSRVEGTVYIPSLVLVSQTCRKHFILITTPGVPNKPRNTTGCVHDIHYSILIQFLCSCPHTVLDVPSCPACLGWQSGITLCDLPFSTITLVHP